MALKEDRVSRWSRLKQKGGAGDMEEATVQAALVSDAIDERGSRRVAEAANGDVMTVPDPVDLPGGDFRRNTIPVMVPLGGIEEEDTAFEAASPEALALLEGETVHDGASGVPPVDMPDADEEDLKERPLTEEEKEIVASLPPIESLGKESDFTPFLSGKVPEFIRRKALSVLWRSDPVLANLDGLNDYDEDYNIIDTLINAATQSNYRVGKGMPGPEDEDEDEEQADNDSAEGADQDAPEEEGDKAVEGEDGEVVASSALEDENGRDGEGGEDDEIPLAQRSIRDVRKPGM